MACHYTVQDNTIPINIISRQSPWYDILIIVVARYSGYCSLFFPPSISRSYFCQVDHLAEMRMEFNLDICRNRGIVITHQSNGSSGAAKVPCL